MPSLIKKKTCSCERAKIKPPYIQISAKSIVGQKTAKPLHALYDKPVNLNFEIVNFPFLDVMSLCASVYMCFVVTCWERADLLALVCGVYCEFVTFPLVSWVRCGT